MKTRILLSLQLLAISFTGLCTTWTITSSGNTFSPSSITINVGDSVKFTITSTHNSVEVGQSVWDANGNTALSGGFSTPMGGGLVLPDKLTAGTHYFVCTPHASIGMKGTITVLNSTGVSENKELVEFSVFPNPSNGEFQVVIDEVELMKNSKLEIYDEQGEIVYETVITDGKPDIILNNPPKGMYLVKIDNGNTIITKKIVIQY